MPHPTPTSNVHFGYLLRACATAALGGMLFGYDTAVIAGTVEFLKEHFELSDLMLGWTVSSALLGCIIGAAGTGWASDRIGRKRTMLACAILFLISALWSGLAQTPGELVFARILGGIGVGAASLLTPVYISEIAPAKMRGALTTLNQIAILIGMVVVYLVNAWLANFGEEEWRIAMAWRWMFGSEALPAALFFGLLFTIPESPRWLILNGRSDKAAGVLKRVGEDRPTREIISEVEASQSTTAISWSALLQPPYRTVLVIGAVLAILQQATGINIVMYYAPRIFTSAGLDTGTAIGHSVIIGVIMLVFTVVAMLLADRAGRRPLLLLSAGGMALSLFALGLFFRAGDASSASLLLACILFYVAAFSIGMGPLVWTVIAEIFPNAIRGRAVGLCVLLLWLTNFLVSQFFPYLLTRFGPATFWIYGGFSVIAVLFIALRVRETKGLTLEAITRISTES